MNFKVLIDFILCFFILEKKSFSPKLQYLISIFKETNLIKYLKYLFINKSINPINSKYFNLYIKKNKNIWKDNKKLKKNTIIVENFINHPGYTLSNAIAAKYLSRIYDSEIVGIIRKGDLKAKALFDSFKFKKTIELNNPNFFLRIKCLVLALKLVPNSRNINDFCKIKFNKVEIGLSTYDSYIRYTKTPTLIRVNRELITMLSQAISSHILINDTISNLKNVKISVQSETVFNPSNIYFQICLLKKIDVFARCGENEISLRRYTDWSQRHQYRYNISNKFFNLIQSNLSKTKLESIKNVYIKKSKNLKYGFDTKIPLVKYLNLRFVNKKQILNKFSWDSKKNIIVFFLNVLIDRNFHNGPRINFKDNFSWTEFMLRSIPNIKNVNWLIKTHPIEKLYSSALDFENEIKKICKKNKHIKLFPKKFANSSLLRIADKIITSHGTAGIEYPAYGIESIFVEKSLYSNMKFVKMIQNRQKLKEKLNNLDKKQKIKPNIKNKSLIFLFIQDFMIKVNCSLIPIYLISRKISQENFWLDSLRKLNKKNIKDDRFFKMLKVQIANNMRHTCDFDKLNITKKKLNDYSN